MRFSSVQQVLDYAYRAAKGDIARHVWYGHSLNPFCTQGARNDWQRGFDNAPPYSWESPTREWDTIFQRGRAAAVLLDRLNETGTL